MEDVLPIAEIADASDARAIEKAARIIRRGGLVAFPTETVYGLGADAQNAQAVARLFEVKARPRLDPVIIHVVDVEMASLYGRFPESASRLMKQFWPGPLTLIVEKTPLVPDIVTAGLKTVAIRVPSHPAALALISATERGIAAPSANPFGYISPTEAQHVAEQLGNSIEMILDGGPCTIGVESTILSMADSPPCILRAGGTAVEDLVPILGELKVFSGSSQHPQAPGQMKRHYATQTRLEILEEGFEKLVPGEKVGLLTLHPSLKPEKYAVLEVLSPSGNLREAAANLFRALRRLDAMSLDRIIARPLEEKGLGLAIMDRLRRCSARG
ncbi:MAG: threonylcarbamoyl-AMP synthase [Acidobacteria bacterium]|nr:threonylcarbamoyl-AMP synthase [Acidobacteriota bacterium]